MLVIMAYPAHNCSSATLFAFAVGMILPITDDNSPTVTLPLFWVCTSISETVETFDASMPYAFKMVVNTSSVCELSANPAFASFVELATKLTASPVFCPAEMALYTSSAMADDAIPVVLESCMISLESCSSGTAFKSAMVATFAMELSYFMAACTGPAYTAAATAPITPTVPSNCVLVAEILSFTLACCSLMRCKFCCDDFKRS